MSARTSTNSVRKQAGASIDAVATEIQQALRQELASLRSALDARLAALEGGLTRDQSDPAFAPTLEKLCEVAAEQAETAAKSARGHAEAEAARQLAEARAEAKKDLDAAHAQAKKDLDAAHAQAQKDLDANHASSEAMRAELEQRLAQSEEAGLEATRSVAEAERVAAAARQEADAIGASLTEARTQIAALEGARADLLMGRDIAEAHLEGEIHNRNAIAAELEAAREKALHAKADADARRLELQRAAARIRQLEQQQPARDGESTDSAASEAIAAIARVRSALQRLTGAATGRAVVDAALESLAENYSRVALCVVGRRGCTVWGSRGFNPPLESGKALIPLGADSPLMRASAAWTPVTMGGTNGEETSGIFGTPIAYAIAMPVVVQERGNVMLYAENTPESWNGDLRVAEKIAEILADHLGQRLRPRKAATPADPSTFWPARQARRVKVQKGTVAVDGAHSTLIDLSTHGAQVLSPRAIKPNCSVRLLLPSDSGGLSCDARVVWVIVEKSQDRPNAMYRAGVQFTDVDTPGVEAFLSQHGIFEPAIRH